MKWFIFTLASVLSGITLAYTLEHTLNPYGNVVEWSIIFSIIINFALLPSGTLAKMMTGMLVGVGCMLGFYLIAYYRNDLGRGGHRFFYWGLFSWSMFGAQFGLFGGGVAVVTNAIIRRFERRGQPV